MVRYAYARPQVWMVGYSLVNGFRNELLSDDRDYIENQPPELGAFVLYP